MTKHRQETMFPQHCFLVCPGLNGIAFQRLYRFDSCRGQAYFSTCPVCKGGFSLSSQEGGDFRWGDFHFFHRSGEKILGGVHVICNMPFLMLQEGHEMANQSVPGG